MNNWINFKTKQTSRYISGSSIQVANQIINLTTMYNFDVLKDLLMVGFSNAKILFQQIKKGEIIIETVIISLKLK